MTEPTASVVVETRERAEWALLKQILAVAHSLTWKPTGGEAPVKLAKLRELCVQHFELFEKDKQRWPIASQTLGGWQGIIDADCAGKVNVSGYVDDLAVIGRPPEHRNYRWLTLGDPQFYSRLCHAPEIADSAIIEALVTVDAGLDRATTVGERTIVMKKAHLAHDVQVGALCNIAPGVMIGGHVTIGDRVKIGLGASIRPRVTVGDDVVIGAGAVVVKDIPAGQKWAGNPARPLHEYVPDSPDRDLWEEWFERSRPPHGLGCADHEGRECDCDARCGQCRLGSKESCFCRSARR